MAVIRRLHNAEPTWVDSEAVFETFEGDVVWDGKVQVFDLEGHPDATRCYALGPRHRGGQDALRGRPARPSGGFTPSSRESSHCSGEPRA